jgi:hypothetical protein
MNDAQEDRFVLLVRPDPGHGESPGGLLEQPLAVCSTYGEARLLRQKLQGTAGDCVIRFIGPAGGGD